MTDINNINVKQRLYQQIVDEILASIDSGEYPVGSRLPTERELVKRFGVGRPTIREAMIALETKNRVAVKAGSGVYVLGQKTNEFNFIKTISPFELIEARVLIEGEAAALAASMITEEELMELEQTMDEMKEENMSDDEIPMGTDKKFHTIVARATHNQLFPFLIEQLWQIQEGLEHIKIARLNVCKYNPEKRLDEHKKVLDALARHDPHESRIAMRKHFSRLLNALHQTTEEQTVREMKHQISQNKKRFSLDRIVEI